MKRLSILFALFPLLGCDYHDDFKQKQANSNKSQLENQVNISGKTQPQTIKSKNDAMLEDKQNTNSDKSKFIVASARKSHVLLNVPLVKQNPELKYGCEVTSLSMVLKYAGVKTDKMELYRRVKKDPDQLVRAKNGDILRWGNPAEGFVGDMTGRQAGYAVFDQPIVNLVNEFLPKRAVNLTNRSFDEVLDHVSKGYPAVVWTTGDYRLPDRWEGWIHGNQYIKTPLDLHAVVLVGYDPTSVYLNDPLSGRKQVRVSKSRFISSWKALKSRAVSYH